MIEDYEGEGELVSRKGIKEKPSGLKVGWDTAALGYGEDMVTETYQKINSQMPDYKEQQKYYDALSSEFRTPVIDAITPISGYIGENIKENFSRVASYKFAVSKDMFKLDKEKNLVPSEGYFIGAELLFNMDAIKGSLLAAQNGVTEDTFNKEYSTIAKNKADVLAEQKKSVSAWGYYPGFIGKHIARPETLLELMAPSKIMGKTIMRGAAKAFGIEAVIGLFAETSREITIRQHMDRADLEYTLWDSVENILINAGFAGALRGIGSIGVDMWQVNKIRKEIPNKTDREIFDIYIKRENDKLITNVNKHNAVLDKVEADINDGKPVDIAEHTDIDINTKADDDIIEISLKEELSNINKTDTEEILSFEKSFDETPEVKEITKADPYEGMATPDEAKQTIDEVLDDPEIKAEYDAIQAEKKLAEAEIASFNKKEKTTPIQAQKVKEAAEIPLGGSEDEAKQRIQDMFKKSKSIDDAFKKMNNNEIDELDAMFKADKELAPAIKEIEDELNADIAGVGGTSVFSEFGVGLFAGGLNGIEYDKESGEVAIDPIRFMEGFLAGHVVKMIATNPKLNAKAKKAALKYSEKLYKKTRKKILEKYLQRNLENTDILVKEKVKPKIVIEKAK